MASAAAVSRSHEPPLLKQTVSFGLPLVVAMALGALFNLVDLYIVAQYENLAEGVTSEVGVAAVTVGSLVNSIPHIIFNGIINAMIALVARYHGLGSKRKANVAAGQGLTLTLVMSVFFGVPPWIYAPEICEALGASGPVLPPATDYLAIMSAGTVTMFLLLHVTGVLRAIGNSVVPLILLGGSNILNIVLDIWFIWGGLGVPEMGVAGAAWATVIARGIFAVAGLALLWRGFLGIKLNRWLWRGRIMWNLLVIGIPSCFQWLVRMLAYLYILNFVAEAAPRAGARRSRTPRRHSGWGSGWTASSCSRASAGPPRPRRSWARTSAGGVRNARSGPRGSPSGLNMCMMLVFASVIRAVRRRAPAPDVLPSGGRAERAGRDGHRTHVSLRRVRRLRVPGESAWCFPRRSRVPVQRSSRF